MTRSYGIARPSRAICGICGEPTNKPTRMCKDCSDSYEKFCRQDGSVAEVIGWAARRARWYEQRRKRMASHAAVVHLTEWEIQHLRDFAHNVDDSDHDALWERLDKKLTAALRRTREVA